MNQRQDRLTQQLDRRIQERTSTAIERSMTRRLDERIQRTKPDLPQRANTFLAERFQTRETRRLAIDLGLRATEQLAQGTGALADLPEIFRGAGALLNIANQRDLQNLPALARRGADFVATRQQEITSILTRLGSSGQPASPADVRRLQRLSLEVRTVQTGVIDQLPANARRVFDQSATLQRAREGINGFLEDPRFARAGRALEVAGIAADGFGAAMAGRAAFERSVFSSTGGRFVDGAVTGLTNFGVSRTPIGAIDTVLGLAGVREQNRIGGFTTQTARGLLALTAAGATGDTAALGRFRQIVQSEDGNIALRALDQFGQSVADTRLLDNVFALQDVLAGLVTFNPERRNRAINFLRNGG